jgi:RecB family exonuclease
MGIRLLACAYGRAALDELTSAVAAAKTDDPMAAVTVVVPTNVAGIVARRHLAAHLPAGDGVGVAALEVTTLRRLAERLATQRLSPRRPATRPLVAAAWRHALATSPGVFEEVSGHPATVRATSDAHRELRDLSPAALSAVAETAPLTDDLARLHRTVVSRLASDYYDEVDLLDEAVAAVRAQPLPGSAIVLLPQEMTRAEAELVRAAADRTDVLVIAGLTGVRRADAAVRRTLELLGVPCDDYRPAHAFAGRVLNASDSDDEVRCVVRELLATLETTPAHRVAVLYANASPYARLLHEQLSSAGVAVNGPGTRPVVERALVRALLETLDLHEQDVPRRELFRALGNAPAHDFTGERVPLARWERISREAGVVKGEDWTVRLDAHVERLEADLETEQQAEDPREWLVERTRRGIADTRALQAFAERLRQELSEAGALTSWRELADWCLSLHTTLFGEEAPRWLPPEEQYAAATILPTLHSLGGLDRIESTTGLDALRAALEAELATATPRVGRFGEGVLVAPLSSAVGLDLDVVHVVGLAEDVYPGRLHEDPLLPERARQAAGGELALSRDRLDAKHRHVLAAFASAPTVVASFPRGDLRRSSRRLPSRFLLPTLRELAADTWLAATQWDRADFPAGMAQSSSFAGELLTTGRLGNEQEWRVREVAATGSLDDPAWLAADALLSARAGDEFTRFDGNLAGAEGLPDLLAGEQVTSSTTLESYAACPHSYFVQRMLRVEPVEEPDSVVEISPTDIGLFVHEVLDALISEHADDLPGFGQPWTDEQRRRLLEIARATAETYERTGRTGHARLWRRSLDRILAVLDWMLLDDDAWRRDNDAKVLASEMPFGMKGRPPVSVPVPGGRILMRGSADKVDVSTDGSLYVTDVKTGSRTKFAGIDQGDPTVGGTKLQLPVYAMAARERYGDIDTKVSAAYWFVRKDRGRLPLELTPEVESEHAAALATIARSMAAGIFPTRAPEEPDFAWVKCPYCNPDGMGHAERRRQWESKRADPALAEYVGLVEPGADS